MAAPINILYPDVKSVDDLAIERAVAPAGAILAHYAAKSAEEVPAAAWREADALVTGIGFAIDDAVLDRAPGVRIITRLGVGYDLIDLAAAGRRGIPVCNVPDYGTTEVADHAIALMLGFLRGIVRYDEAFRDDAAGWDFRLAGLVRRLSGTRLGIVGIGRIGSAVALRAKALGMSVAAFDPYAPRGHELALGIARAESLDALLGAADVVSLHTPLSAETRHLIDADRVAAMAEGAILINTSRGGVVDLDAVEAGLRAGRIGAAGLDVFETEPPPAEHPLLHAWRAREPWLAGRLIVTPHAAFYSPASVRDMREKAVLTCADFLAGGQPRNCVNLDLLAKKNDN